MNVAALLRAVTPDLNRCADRHPEHSSVQCARELGHRYLRRGPRRHWHTGILPERRGLPTRLTWIDIDEDDV